MRGELTGRVALATGLVCLVVVLGTIGVLLMPAVRLKLGIPPTPVPSYPTGTTIDVPSEVYNASPYTLVLFARSDCGVCQRMKPWLRQLVAELSQQPTSRVVMLTKASDGPDEIVYASELGIDPQRVLPMTPVALKVRQVPTAVLVDQHGVVLYSQEGAPRTSEAEVIKTMVLIAQRQR